MNRYTYRAEWSVHFDCYLGRCLEFPGVWARAATAPEEVADRLAQDMPVPESLCARTYSGRFVLRLSPEMHEKLSMEATEQGVPTNRLVVQKLAGRAPSLDDLC